MIIENKTVVENNYPPSFPFFLAIVEMKKSTIKMNHARKRYVERLCLKMLIIGQLKSIMPSKNRNMPISLVMDKYYTTGISFVKIYEINISLYSQLYNKIDAQ